MKCEIFEVKKNARSRLKMACCRINTVFDQFYVLDFVE